VEKEYHYFLGEDGPVKILILNAIFSLLLLQTLASGGGLEHLGGNYFRKSGKILLKIGKDYIPVKNVDAATYKHIAHGYTMDKNGVYWERDLIREADKNSFIVLSSEFSKDKNNVYFLGSTVKSAHSSSFISIFGYFGKDSLAVYYQYDPIPGADPSTFEVLINEPTANKDEKEPDVLRAEYSRDHHNGYFNKDILTSADPAALKLLGNSYITDGTHVYHSGMMLNSGAKGFCISNDDSRVGIDTIGNRIYLYGRFSFEGADAKSFKILGKDYYKDSKNVYYYHSGRGEDWIVDGADPATFIVLSRYKNGEAKDRNNSYYLGEVTN
jgi:hypothetical protein